MDINTIKSSGIYREVIDEINYNVTTSTSQRMLVGFSYTGPFNRPIYFENVSEFERYYGHITEKEEGIGSFFNRSCRHALLKSPIMAINVKHFEDKNRLQGLYIADGIVNKTVPDYIGDIAVTTLYDTSDFWKIVPQYIDDGSVESVLGQKPPITIWQTYDRTTSNTYIIRKYIPEGYDVTIKDWLKNNENPDCTHGWSDIVKQHKMNEIFGEIYVFRGQFTPEIISSPALSKFFVRNGADTYIRQTVTNSFGEVVDALEELSQIPQSNFINVYRGVLAPGFIDKRGRALSIDVIFNNDNGANGAVMVLDTDSFDNCPVILNNLSALEFSGMNDQQSASGTTITGFPSIAAMTFDGTNWSLPTQNGTYYNTYTYYMSNTYGGNFNITGGSDTVIVGNHSAIMHLISFLDFCIGNDCKLVNSDGTFADNAISYVWQQDIPIMGKDTLTISGQNIKFDLLNDNLTLYVSRTASVTSGSVGGAMGIMNICEYREGYWFDTPAGNTEQDKYNFFKDKSTCELRNNTGVQRGLSNRISCPFHYLVDTYESFGVRDSIIKSDLAFIVHQRDNTFGLLNFPSDRSLDQFRNNRGDGYDVILNNSHITLVNNVADSGDRVAYFTPFLWQDATRGGRKRIIPSAAIVSNRFMDKIFEGKVYSPVAGPRLGGLSLYGLIGPEHGYDRADRDVLEPYGVNVLMYDKQRGTYINSNRTGLKNTEGLLTFANISELCISLQDEIEEMLMEYHFEFNNDATRTRVAERARRILQRAKDNKAIYDYRVVCDSTNNPDNIIDNEMIVLDCYIEPAIAAGKMLQRLYLKRTQTISNDTNRVVQNFENYL